MIPWNNHKLSGVGKGDFGFRAVILLMTYYLVYSSCLFQVAKMAWLRACQIQVDLGSLEVSQ